MSEIKRLIFDIGHGGTDSGASANGLKEKDINLIVGLSALDYINNNYIVDAKVTRDKDVTLDENKRVKIITDFNPHLSISIHHNAAGSVEARGSEVIHAHYDKDDDVLANDIMDELLKLGMPKRRAFTKLNDHGNDWYYMIRRIWDTDTDAIIVEGGFLTNKDDAKLLKDVEFLKAEGRVIAECAARYLGLEKKPIILEETVKTWQQEIGEKAIDELYKDELLSESEEWKKKDLTNESTPLWLFFEMMNRVKNL